MDQTEAATTNGDAARIEDGVRTYGTGQAEVRALDGVTRAFPAGKFTAIMGPSGSGKSTLMQCMAGLDRLSSGRTWIGDVELTDLSEKEITKVRRERVGFIFQAFNLVPTLNAEENIRLPLDIAGRDGDGDWISEVIGTLNLGDRLTHRPNELSGVSSSVSPPRGRSRRGPTSSSPTSRPGSSTPTARPSCCRSCATPSTTTARPS